MRIRRQVLSAVVLAAVALPGVRTIIQGDDAPDGFPLSTYPMFTRDRGRMVEVPAVVVAKPDDIDDVDDIERLSPSEIADTDQVIEAHEVVARAIRGGTADALCNEVAGRLELETGEHVEVVLERYDTIAWSAGDEAPISREVVASCP